MVRVAALIALCMLAWAPTTSAHGALTINEFDTYAISDFEGHEDSFAWEGFEIWDVYAGDGHHEKLGSHGVYFKVNFAGDGTLRPGGGQTWEARFTFKVGAQDFARTIAHDGTEVTTDFEALEWQVADGNVFQVHAWVPVAAWEGQSIDELVVASLVDGELRDLAPGGIFVPVVGAEAPVNVPETPVFPEMGEGRIVETVPLTGAAKFLDVSVMPEGDGWFDFSIKNPLAAQGQHVMFHAGNQSGWQVDMPNPMSLDGGASASFRLRLEAGNGTTEPLRFEVMSDIGGMLSYYAFVGAAGVEIVDDPALAVMTPSEEPVVDTPAPMALLPMALALLARRLGG